MKMLRIFPQTAIYTDQIQEDTQLPLAVKEVLVFDSSQQVVSSSLLDESSFNEGEIVHVEGHRGRLISWNGDFVTIAEEGAILSFYRSPLVVKEGSPRKKVLAPQGKTVSGTISTLTWKPEYVMIIGENSIPSFALVARVSSDEYPFQVNSVTFSTKSLLSHGHSATLMMEERSAQPLSVEIDKEELFEYPHSLLIRDKITVPLKNFSTTNFPKFYFLSLNSPSRVTYGTAFTCEGDFKVFSIPTSIYDSHLQLVGRSVPEISGTQFILEVAETYSIISQLNVHHSQEIRKEKDASGNEIKKTYETFEYSGSLISQLPQTVKFAYSLSISGTLVTANPNYDFELDLSPGGKYYWLLDLIPGQTNLQGKVVIQV